MSDDLRLTVGLFCIGALFSFLGAIVAFLISYQGYSHHFLPKEEVFRLSMRSGRFAFIVLLVISLILAIVLKRVIS
jgi:hypothetical protein